MDYEKKYNEALDFKTKLAEYMMKNRTGYSYNISSESILELAKEELIKRGELQKPAWSDEDEKIKERLITRLNWITHNTRTDGTSPNITFFDEIAWLKSLRPQWKPTEEQMEALEFVIRDYREDSCNATANYLQEILDHLKNM